MFKLITKGRKMKEDYFAHLKGFCEINRIGQVQPDSEFISVSFSFMGLELLVQVPRMLMVAVNGVRSFNVGDFVYLDCRLGGDSSIKSFEGNTYVKQNLMVKSVVELRKVDDKVK